MNDVILGAGISGKIVKHFLPDAHIYESSLPGIHTNSSMGANYVWEKMEGFACDPVEVRTTVDHKVPEIESIRRYKNKIGKDKENQEDWKEQFLPVQKGFILRNQVVEAHYGWKCVRVDLVNKLVEFDNGGVHKFNRLFSTVPLPALLKLTGLDLPLETIFRYRPIYVTVELRKLMFDAHVIHVNYVSSPCDPVYRETMRFGENHRESLTPPMSGRTHVLTPGKIWDSPQVPKILEDLAEHSVYCFGRYARWSSDELIHQTYQLMQACMEDYMEAYHG